MEITNLLGKMLFECKLSLNLRKKTKVVHTSRYVPDTMRTTSPEAFSGLFYALYSNINPVPHYYNVLLMDMYR